MTRGIRAAGPIRMSGPRTTRLGENRQEYASSGFFVLRTPLLPVETLRQWLERARGMPGPAEERCGTSDRLRAELRRLFEAEDIREALFLASPVLEDAFARAPRTSDPGRERRLDAALAKYL